VTGKDCCWRRRASVKPAGPAPMMAIFGCGMVLGLVVDGDERYWLGIF
jgi:hypothetical protein